MSKKFNPGAALAAMTSALQPKAGYVTSQALVGGDLSKDLREIAVEDVVPSPFQPRVSVGEEHVQELAADIDAHGLTHPIVVRPHGTGFELIAGEARWLAFRSLGRSKIPAIVRVLSDFEAMWATLTENTQREDMSDFEVARAIKIAMDSGAVSTPTEAHRAFRINRGDVYRYMAFFELPDEVTRQLASMHRKVGRSAAYELQKLHVQFAECVPEFVTAVLQCLAKLESGELLQDQLAKSVLALVVAGQTDQSAQTKIKQESVRPVEVVDREGVVLGKIERKNNRLVIGLDRKLTLPAGLELELAEFLKQRLAEYSSGD